ncbi:hypothetical protein TSA1_08455 [Bradyrhizobium nitroreducens]|uniref:Uncharacterized protein n=1 Tax=Bradyrhizobium nitroreducens TaxID=709803 RepID=A0A2M6U866_9BRAD|nr:MULTISPECIES: hypothetical protein [Bradyrhizobium]PIT00796.1 hypothetical protein TSA1_08455 [Bradyrhizobium nitroreducens]TQF42610.1 hypothetical protein UNPF46_04750 [Bradyrhizobium sp. UNPF46]
MTTLKLLSTGLIAVAMLGGPVAAHTSHAVARSSAMQANSVASEGLVYQGGRVCVPAPRVGAFATAPWTGDNVPCEPGTAGLQF